MSKEIVNKETGEVTEFQNNDAWGPSEMSGSDILIPRISMMQPMSEGVTGGKHKFGEFVESLSGEVIGSFDEPFDIVPVYMEKLWKVYMSTPGKRAGEVEKTWLRNEPITPKNEGLKYEGEEMINGRNEKIVRDKVMQFYVLLVKDLKLGTALPNILSFSKSSIKAGQKLATQMYIKNVQSGKNPASMICTVKAEKKTNDNGTFAVADVIPKSATPNEYVAEAFGWLTKIKSGKTRADKETDDAGEGEDLEVEELPKNVKEAKRPPNMAPQSSEEAKTGRF